ncbi:MAG: 30S ribosomal protein S6 [Candidatus Zixiibacteriota bacterium]
MKLYETTFILNPELKEEGWEQSIAKYSGIITQNGTIRNVYRWGLRRMTYEIEKQTHGYYVHIIHESAPSIPRELERQFLLDETCLRYLTVLGDNPLYLEEIEKQKLREASAEGMRAPDAEGDARPETATAAAPGVDDIEAKENE